MGVSGVSIAEVRQFGRLLPNRISPHKSSAHEYSETHNNDPPV